MKVLNQRFDIDSTYGSIEIDLYGDTHLGSASVTEDMLRKHIKETNDNNRYWAHLGDAIDGILPGDKRHNASNVADWAWAELKNDRLIEAEWDRFYELYRPIQDKCLFVLDGDGKHNVCGGISDCMRNVLNAMHIRGVGPSLYFNASIFRNQNTGRKIPLVFHHGWFAGRTSSNKVTNLERALGVYPKAWGFFCGHGHHKTVTRVDSLMSEGKYIKQWIRRAAMTGSYLLTYADNTVGYGEVKGYPPAALGRITVRIAPFHEEDEKQIELFNV